MRSLLRDSLTHVSLAVLKKRSKSGMSLLTPEVFSQKLGPLLVIARGVDVLSPPRIAFFLQVLNGAYILGFFPTRNPTP